MGGAGTATAALGFGGDSPGYPTATESFDGTSWTVVPATLTQGKDNAASFGLQTAAIFATGYAGPPAGPTGNTANVGSYNGSAWTEVNNVNTARSYVQGCGTQTSGIIAGGSAPPYSAAAETWDGTSWTTVNDINTARANFSTFGTQTFAVGSGGDDGSTPRFTIVEAYDGTTWTEVANLANANKMSASSGTAGTAGINFGGSDPGNNPMTRTEEWTTVSPLSIAQEGQVWYNSSSKVLKGLGGSVPAGSWASAPSLNTGRSSATATKNGTTTAALNVGGAPRPVKNTESYDGTAWTEVNDMNSAATDSRGGAGTQAAGILGGGSSPTTTESETWDGTCWTEVNNINTGRYQVGAFGTQTAAMLAGGRGPTDAGDDFSETYDGTSWAEGNDLNNARRTYNSGGGTSTAGIMAGGGEPNQDYTETYDGTSWTEVADLNTARMAAAMAGSKSLALIFGGPNGPPYTGATEAWDGTSWTEVGDLSIGTGYQSGAGSSSAALSIGGKSESVAQSAVTEEWGAGTAIKTFTAS
jgi:hypothetical protein